jgi:LacI family transcriptional regulator
VNSAAQPTVADVADAAGVSRQTVSNVLNAPQRVRPETRQRVEDAIAQLGYQPNRVARALRAQASKLIGYRIESVHPQSLANIHDRLLHALADAGREADHHLFLFTSDDHDDEIASSVRLHRSGAVDGFILYGIQHGDGRTTALRQLGVPFVAFGRTGYDDDHIWVDVDNAAGTTAAVEHLVERGHRRIAFIGFPEGTPVTDRRAEGWRTGLDKHGLLSGCLSLDVRGDDNVANGARFGGLLLDGPGPPTAIVTVTDTLAVGAMQALRTRGLVPGQDVAIVGFDDTPTAAALDLSSIRQPIEAVGRALIRALLGQLSLPTPQRGTALVDASRLLMPSLVVRASSAAPAATDHPL